MITTYFLKSISEDIYKHQHDPNIPYYYYLGLSSTEPTIDGINVTEPTATEYYRVEIDNMEDFGHADETGLVTNNKPLYFPESLSDWGEIKYYVIFDSQTEGNLLLFGEFEESISVPLKTKLTIPINTLGIVAQNIRKE